MKSYVFLQSLSDAIKAKEQAEKKIKELKKDSKKTTNQPNYYRVFMLLVINITQIDFIFCNQCPSCPKTFLNGEFLHGHWQRRHPEYVNNIISTSAPVADSPVQPVVISSPVKVFCNDTPTVLHNEEISELKERLQLAEKQLQNEQQLLHTVMEKV